MAGSRRLDPAQGRFSGDPAVFHGEGAFWDSAAGTLRYVDMLSGDVMTRRDRRDDRTHLGDVVAMIRPRVGGGYVAAVERGFVLLDDDLTVQKRIPVFDDPAVRMNEGACDAAGRLYCGSLEREYRPGEGTLYRLDPDLSVRVVLESVTIPNGLVWSLDGTAAFHADTAEGRIWRYEFDLATGSFGEREVLVDFVDTAGAPDGIAMDAQGGLWVALWGGAAVRRYDSSGSLTDHVPLPVTYPTSCAIGGPSGTTLFVTTSRLYLTADQEPEAGLVFELEIGVGAAPVHPFAG